MQEVRQTTMKHLFLSFIVTVFLTGLCSAYPGELEIRMTADRLSLHADQVPLKEILRRMAGMGIKVRIDPKLNPDISVRFENRDIQSALGSVLKSLDHVLLWDAAGMPGERTFRLSEIQVFRSGRKDLMIPLGRNSLTVVKNPKDGSLFVKDEILLKLAPGTGDSDFRKILKKIGGTVTGRNAALGVYKIRLPENTDVPALAELISKYPKIAEAKPDYAYSVAVPRDFFSGIGDTPVPAADGTVPIAVLDTGLARDADMDKVVRASLDALNPDDPISDSQGHGTQMALIAAGIIKPYGVAEDKSESRPPLIPIRAFDDNGFTSDFGIMNSIDFALKNGARVMSLSWGSETKSEFLEDAVDYAASKNIIIVAAAGNEPTGKPFYPAAYPSVIAVAALGPDGKPWEKSNYGSFVDLSAPGFATLPVGYKGDPGTYAGTSISAAFVANRVADYLSGHPDATKQQVYEALKDISGVQK